MVAVGARAGNHLADEAGEEEHYAKDDGEKCEVEERLVGNGAEVSAVSLADKLGHDNPHGHNASNHEHQQPRKAKEMHRLLTEST